MSAHSMLTQAEFMQVQDIRQMFIGAFPGAHLDPDLMDWWEMLEQKEKEPVPSGARRDWSTIMEEIG